MRLSAILFLVAAALPGCAANDPAEDGPTKEELAEASDSGKGDGIDWCKLRRYYGDGDCDRFCDKHDSDCPLLGPEPQGRQVQYPIIFHHGFAGGHGGVFAWNGVKDALKNQATVEQTEVPPFDSIEVRTAYLKQVVDATLAATGKSKVNIIAHSMGGLDARHLISKLGYGDRVASLTTISTPHYGTAAADLGLGVLPGFTSVVLNAVFEILGAQINDNATSTNVRRALHDLSEGASGARNESTPNDGRVYYQSYAGVATILGRGSDLAEVSGVCQGKLLIHADTMDKARGLFVLAFPVIGHLGKDPHDGLVTVASSIWGDFKGCIPADHSDEVGQLTSGSPDPRTSFDPGRFYQQIADDLAARGF